MRRTAQSAVALALTAVAQLFPAAPASAAGDSRTVTTGSTFCLRQSMSIPHDEGTPIVARGRIESLAQNCITARPRPAPFLAQQFYLLYTKVEGGHASVCAFSDRHFNQRTASSFSVELPIGAAHCGVGWYALVAYGHIYEDGRWTGGATHSGWEHLTP